MKASAAYMEIEIHNCEQTFGDRDNFIDFSDLKVRKMNKTTRGIFGKMVIHTELDNSYIASVKVFVKQGGEYRALPYKVQKAICDFCNEDEFLFPDLVAASDIPMPMPCPIPKVKTKNILSPIGHP